MALWGDGVFCELLAAWVMGATTGRMIPGSRPVAGTRCIFPVAFADETAGCLFWMSTTKFLPCIWAAREGGCSFLEEGSAVGMDHLTKTVGGGIQ